MLCSKLGGMRSIAALLALFAATAAYAQDSAPKELTPRQQAFRRIYQELVEINTTNSVGDTVRSAEAMAAELKNGGLPAADVQVISSSSRKGDMVARLRGTGARKPMLLIAHMDVVEAKREDWDFDPFKLQEIGGTSAAAAPSTTRQWLRSLSPT